MTHDTAEPALPAPPSLNQWIPDGHVAAPGWFSDAAKRSLDISLALFGFVAFAPIALLIIVMILLDDGRPIFYSQVRVGRSSKPYRIWKFRSMIRDAETTSGPAQASEDDPRVTRVGDLLRRTGMDELPQLWSILKGDMSFVGPRAYRQHFVDKFRAQIDDYDQVLAARPGLTGLAQIYGPKAPTAHQKWRLDVLYIVHCSLWLDIRLIFLSGWITLMGRWESHRGKV